MNTVPALFLRDMRVQAGFTSARSAAIAMRVPVATYLQHESGKRAFTADQGFEYGAFFIAIRAMRLHARPPIGHEHLAAQLHAIINRERPERPLWRDMSDAEREPYRLAADMAFLHDQRALPADRIVPQDNTDAS